MATDEQVADILTKRLPVKKYEYLRSKLGIIENVSLAEKEW